MAEEDCKGQFDSRAFARCLNGNPQAGGLKLWQLHKGPRCERVVPSYAHYLAARNPETGFALLKYDHGIVALAV